MSKKLTDKQEMFCREYLLDLNATQAAIRAGYSEKTARFIGTENLSKPNIADRVSNLKAERIKDTKIDASYVLKRLVEIDQMDVADILNEDGSVKSISEWPKVWRQYISGIDLADMFEGHGEDREMVGILKKIKWPDKVKNLDMIGRHVDVGAWEKDTAPVVVSNNIMPVPTAASADEWEKAAQAQQDKSLSRS